MTATAPLALTTTFSPPPSCSTDTWYIEYVKGRTTTPHRFRTASRAGFSVRGRQTGAAVSPPDIRRQQLFTTRRVFAHRDIP